MKVREYLQSIRNCNDEQTLRNKYGLHDNWPFMLRADASKISLDFRRSKMWTFSRTLKQEPYTSEEFMYSPGTIMIRLDNISNIDWSPCRREFTEEQRIHFAKHQNYSSNIVLYTDQGEYLQDRGIIGKKMQGVTELKSMTMAIESLSNYFIANRIPFFLPFSSGHGQNVDLSNLVYYPDAEEDQIQSQVRSLLEGVRK